MNISVLIPAYNEADNIKSTVEEILAITGKIHDIDKTEVIVVDDHSSDNTYDVVRCSNLPVGWGGTYKVLYKNEKVITIEYDELMSSYESILRVANEHCGSFSKVAIPTGPANTTRAGGALKTHTFKCE